MKKILRGDIYLADLDPVFGSEQGGERPVLVIQNDIGNEHSPTVIVAVITSKVNEKSNLPTHFFIGTECGLNYPSIVLLEQIRTIDKARLKKYIGTLDKQHMMLIDEALAISIDLKNICRRY